MERALAPKASPWIRPCTEEFFCPVCRGETTELGKVKRHHYNKHNEQDRKRLVKCDNKGGDWVLLAGTLRVKYIPSYF